MKSKYVSAVIFFTADNEITHPDRVQRFLNCLCPLLLLISKSDVDIAVSKCFSFSFLLGVLFVEITSTDHFDLDQRGHCVAPNDVDQIVRMDGC